MSGKKILVVNADVIGWDDEENSWMCGLVYNRLGDTKCTNITQQYAEWVDGDTVDVTLDLGFDILYNNRIRLHMVSIHQRAEPSDLEEKKRERIAC